MMTRTIWMRMKFLLRVSQYKSQIVLLFQKWVSTCIFTQCTYKGTSTLCRAAHSGKVARQKWRHATSICGHCVGLAAACCSMLPSLKIWSANCWSHQKKPHGIWWVRGFKMVSASLRKKSDQVRRSCSTVLVTWRRSAKNSFFSCGCDRIGGICRATFAAWQSCSVLHSVGAPLSFRTGLRKRRNTNKKLFVTNYSI